MTTSHFHTIPTKVFEILWVGVAAVNTPVPMGHWNVVQLFDRQYVATFHSLPYFLSCEDIPPHTYTQNEGEVIAENSISIQRRYHYTDKRQRE